MKKVIAAILALSLVFAFSLTSFADYLPDEEQHLTTILNTVKGGPGNAAASKAQISTLQNKTNGYDKPVIKYCLDKLKANGSIDDTRYANLIAALEAAPDTVNPKVTMQPGTDPTATTAAPTTAPTTAPSGGGTTSGSGSLLPDLTLPNLPTKAASVVS